jgi:hypothetical protein
MSLSNNFWQTTTPATPVWKATGYIVVPALGYYIFSAYGASFVVASFTYQCPNNIVIPTIPASNLLGSNFNLTLRFNDPQTGAIVRYKFWDFGQEPVDCPSPVYAGQPIWGGNFLIEVWSRSGQPSLSMPQTVLLNTTVKANKNSLQDADTYQLGTSTQCPTLQSTNGLNVPLAFLSCAAGQATGIQVGTNYIFDEISGMLMLYNTTTGQYNSIWAQGTTNNEYLVLQPPAQTVDSPTTNIPSIGANYRFNSVLNTFEFKNLTTGEYNQPNTIGLSGLESLVLQPQIP